MGRLAWRKPGDGPFSLVTMQPKQRILITGGTGSLGTALVRRWYDKHYLTVLSRDPHKQTRLTAEFPKVRFVLADICNAGEVYKACEGQDILVHCAALKDVGTGEYYPSEFIRVNVTGSQTVAEAWRETHKARPNKALLISTDKACASINLYGKTKATAESVFRKYDYSVVRYGNVMGSNGSFLPLWRDAITQGKPIKVRTPEPTRFFLKMDDAIALIEDALDLIEHSGENGIFVPHNLKAFSIADVARALNHPVEMVSLLPYEKQHESLVAEGEDVVMETELLARIRPGWNQNWRLFKSDVAQRMTGEEVLEVLGWNIITNR
jgi:UDP-N-acetylglucosamine 4,6-dehydratase